MSTAGASATNSTTGADATIAAGAGAIHSAIDWRVVPIRAATHDTNGTGAMYTSTGAGAAVTTGAGAMDSHDWRHGPPLAS